MIIHNDSDEYHMLDNVGGGDLKITKIFDSNGLKVIVYYAGVVETKVFLL